MSYRFQNNAENLTIQVKKVKVSLSTSWRHIREVEL